MAFENSVIVGRKKRGRGKADQETKILLLRKRGNWLLRIQSPNRVEGVSKKNGIYFFNIVKAIRGRKPK